MSSNESEKHPSVLDVPGASLSTFLKYLGWISISLGVLSGVGMFVATSEFGSGVSLGDAAKALAVGVVSGALLLAISVVIDLLRQISRRLAAEV